jgi:T5orf172 domain
MLGNSAGFYVYLIECVPVGIYKIGYARDPERRMRKLEDGGALGPARYRYGLSWHDDVAPWQSEACKPYRLRWYAPAARHRRAECALHERFADKRIAVKGWRGPEWFMLDAADVDYLCSIERLDGGAAIRRTEGDA